MLEVSGDLWEFHEAGETIVITTNGVVKKNGECVMSRGIALEAKARFPTLPFELGKKLYESGNHCQYFSEYRLFTLPTKHHWYEKSDIQLIARSLGEFVVYVANAKLDKVYLPRPGCGNGKLDWMMVRPVVASYLTDNKFIIVNNE